MIPLYQVDAFSDRPFAGNPAGVCLLLEHTLPPEVLQQVAAEVNCPETAFLERTSGEEFRLRWFTPTTEVDLCGHATLASAHVLWEDERVDAHRRIAFETSSGRLTAVRDREGWIWLDFPAEPPSSDAVPEALSEILRNEPVRFGRTPRDLFAELEDESAVRDCRPNLVELARLETTPKTRGLIVTARAAHPGESPYDFVSRFFAPSAGVPEDPVTGSAHCALGPYWASRLERGEVVGRQVSARGGVVRVRVGTERVEIGGRAVTTVEGRLANPSASA